jgi:hypothetical protein
VRLHVRETIVTACVLAYLMPLASSAYGSPAGLLASVLAAARTERSVHYSTAGSYGAVQVSFVGDAGVAQGIQQITYRKGTKTGHVTVVVSANTAYVRGDAFTLGNYMGFKSSAAAKYAGDWISIPHTASGFSTVSAGVTLSSTIDELKPPGRLSTVPETTIDGQRVLGVRGTKSSSGHTTVETLYAKAIGSPLPVKELASQGTMHFAATFGRWNEPIHLAKPKRATPCGADIGC